MRKIQRVALLMGQDIGYCRGVLRGIRTYAVHKMRWVFRDAFPDARVLGPLREWQPDGIIAHLFDLDFARQLLALRKPLVNTTATLLDLRAPLIDVDHRRVGRLAAAHLLERGFKNFGYFGSAWAGFSILREAAFRNALADAGFSLSACHAEYLPRPPLDASWKIVDRETCDWLRALPKPVAILASNDAPARQLAETCRQLGFKVPEDVALLGVDNDELECLLSNPPLSSIVNPAERIGFEAARLLNRLMSGKGRPRRPILVAPRHVVTRMSTDVVATADPEVSAAVAFIRNHAGERIRAADVVRELNIARRGLERRFRKDLGRSVLEEIQRVRVERAKHLLAETDLLMPSIARRSGFATPQRLGAVFQQATGESPSAYRQRLRVRA